MRKINKAGLELIKSFEGFSEKPYLCPAGIPTIGYGATSYKNGKKISMSDPPISEAEAEELLVAHVTKHEAAVESMVTIPINDNQFSALVSFSYNVGSSALKSSTLLRYLNSGDVSGAADQFLRWNKAAGKILTGLTRRREAERSLFLKSIPASSSSEHLLSGPGADDIDAILKSIEDEIL